MNIHYITCLSSNKESRQGWLDPGAASGDVQAEEDLEEREVWEGEGVFLLKFRGQVSEAKDRICEYSKNRDVQNRSDCYELLEQVRIMMNVTGKDPSARPFTRVPEFGGSRAREGRGAGGTSERWRDRKQAVAVRLEEQHCDNGSVSDDEALALFQASSAPYSKAAVWPRAPRSQLV